MRKFIALILTALVAAPIVAQWGGGSCSGQSNRFFPGRSFKPPAQVVPVTGEWRAHSEDPDRIYYFRGGVQVGGWNYTDSYWRDYNAATDSWGPRQAQARYAPPAQAPAAKKAVEPVEQHGPIYEHQPIPNFGVDLARISVAPKIILTTEAGTREIPKALAVELVETGATLEEMDRGDIPYDCEKFRLTVIGDKAERKPVMDAWEKEDSDLRKRVIAWSVSRDHHCLSESDGGKAKFKVDGKPTIYFTAPDGAVLQRQDDFKGPADFEAIRKAVKKYDDSLDPDLRKPGPGPQPKPLPTPPPPGPAPEPIDPTIPMNPVIPAALLLGGAGLIIALSSKRNRP